ncbi:hypothetical protein [Mesorhizobium sp. CA4]|uniref:hypothetical protein n=1 Tax=Mesorhizobium sp. CA4 TaxID=588499 RepID=UPI001CD0F130|nr:hypothetical protein [Mesorhizobium sp. CA4]MBZ9822374.1 hypothetical protein [Mesorhizobium sp. CA4]
MRQVDEVLTELLAKNPGPVSIAAGIAALRAVGNEEPVFDLQSLIASYAAEQGRAIRFDVSFS